MTTTTAAVVESGGGPFTLHEAGVGELEEIRALTRGGTDISIEATGSAALRRQAVDALAPLGTCGIVGAPAHGTEVSLDLTHLLTAGRVVRGIVAGDSIPDLFLPQLHGSGRRAASRSSGCGVLRLRRDRPGRPLRGVRQHGHGRAAHVLST